MLLALDRLRLGTVLMLEDCTVIHSNETARTILHARDGLRLDMAQRLEASDSRASQWLREVVREVSQTAALNGLTADRACAIGRPSGKTESLITEYGRAAGREEGWQSGKYSGERATKKKK